MSSESTLFRTRGRHSAPLRTGQQARLGALLNTITIILPNNKQTSSDVDRLGCAFHRRQPSTLPSIRLFIERERERESGEWEGVGVSNFGGPSLLEAARCGLPFSDYVIEKCREPVVRRTLFVAAAAADADRVKADLAACVCQR